MLKRLQRTQCFTLILLIYLQMILTVGIYYLGKWDEDKERKLYDCLDEINECGGSFLLSNVIENNGKWNKILDEWSKKYNVLEVSASYESCNYQRKMKEKPKRF